jgi:formylglycine-generating enzyme required for sulfatase activity
VPEFTNGVGMKLVWIEPGSDGKPKTFLMGSPDGTTPPGVPKEEGRSDEETPHKVMLTRGFYLSATLVTQEQWETVLGKEANPSRFSGDKSQLPVDGVSWFDCVEYCNQLSEREGKQPCYRLDGVKRVGDRITEADVELLADATGYRLPTEAEWEYACRAGTATPFWFGDSLTDRDANYDARTYAYGKDGKKGVARRSTTKVREFKPNPWGLYDMHGNLSQWCQDWYNPYPDRDQTDPVGLNKDGVGARVLRGGSWVARPWYCRAACRYGYAPALRGSDVGCRVVCRLD